MSTNDSSLDPTAAVATICDLAARPVTLDGKVITLLDISKVKSAELLDRLEVLLRERARPKAILRRRKPTFASPARTRSWSKSSERATPSSRRWPTEDHARRAVCTTACTSRPTAYRPRSSFLLRSCRRRDFRPRPSARRPIRWSLCRTPCNRSRRKGCNAWPTRSSRKWCVGSLRRAVL